MEASTTGSDLDRGAPVDHHQVGRFLAAGRIVVGVAALVVPGPLARALGVTDGRAGRMLVRMFGAREVALGAGCLHTLDHQPDGAPAWLRASAVADGVDAAASVLTLPAGGIRGVAISAAATLAAVGNWRAADRLD